MTVFLLLAYILAALLLQLAAGIAIATWHRRRAGTHPAPAGDDATPRIERGAWPGWREFRVVRREFEDRARTQCSFYLAPVDGTPLPPFIPGQFLTFAVPVGERTITRCYSLSDRPDPAGYRITVKRIQAPADKPGLPPGLSSSHFHDFVQVGQAVNAKAPAGHFCIDRTPDVPAVLVAGGIGITPMMSMLRWCLAEQPSRVVHLYFGVRGGGEHAFKLQLEQLAAAHTNLHLNVAYSRPGPDDVQSRDYQHPGHVDIDLLKRTLPHGRHKFYICGPAAMMQSLVPALAGWGVASTDLHYEAFGPATVRLPDAARAGTPAALGAEVEIRFLRSGRTLPWDARNETLLDFAERHGVQVESGCRSGSCGTCETKLVSGEVRYANPPDHTVAPGHCLLCVGMPASALVLEA